MVANKSINILAIICVQFARISVKNEIMRTIAIVPAAGFGKRLGLKTKKPFVSLGGEPLVLHALRALNGCNAINAIVIAAEKGCIGRFKKLVADNRLNKVIAVCAGGETRFESVRNGLRLAGPSYDIVLVTDGARPFITSSMISRSVKTARKFGACITAVPESDTVKVIGKGGFIKKTLDRKTVYRAQTPQTFRRSILVKAYASSNGMNVTDDSGLVEALGVKVRILEGSRGNIKITTKEDLRLAEELL